jgi:hypothetical protein
VRECRRRRGMSFSWFFFLAKYALAKHGTTTGFRLLRAHRRVKVRR